MVLGSHGDLMVPLSRYATVSGIPVTDLIGHDTMRDIIEKTKTAGSDLVALLQSGSAYYAASSAIISMVDAVLRDKHKAICSSVLCRGEYGFENVFLGVPVVLGIQGVERIIELRLNKQERKELLRAAEHLRERQEAVDHYLIGQ
jgi:malate dehydrogenase